MPLWAVREFRWLVIVAVLGVTTVGVLVFEIGPKMQAKKKQQLLAAQQIGRASCRERVYVLV